MHHLSRWAFRYPAPARLLIICIELTNAALGLLLGANSWALLTGAGTALTEYLQVFFMLLIGCAFTIRYLYHTADRALMNKAGYRYGLFVINFLLYIALGATSTERAGFFHPSGSVGGSREVRYATGSDTLTSAQAKPALVAPNDKREPAKTSPADERTGTRIGYLLLFVAGLALAYGAAAVSCNLACAGYGFASAMVLLLGTGILAGGFYFFGRAVDKNMKFYREMNRDERKREKRRFFRTWAGVGLVLLLLSLISTLN